MKESDDSLLSAGAGKRFIDRLLTRLLMATARLYEPSGNHEQ